MSLYMAITLEIKSGLMVFAVGIGRWSTSSAPVSSLSALAFLTCVSSRVCVLRGSCVSSRVKTSIQEAQMCLKSQPKTDVPLSFATPVCNDAPVNLQALYKISSNRKRFDKFVREHEKLLSRSCVSQV